MSEKTKQLIKFILPFSFLMAAAWHLPYWSTFDVNPFEFMDINDIVMSFIYPFIFSILITIIPGPLGYGFGLFFGYTRHKLRRKKASDKAPHVGALDEKKDDWNFLNSSFLAIITYLMIIAGIIFTYFTQENDKKWMTIPFLIQLMILASMFTKDIIEMFNLDLFKRFLITLLSFLVTISIIRSKTKAIDVRDMKCYDYTYDLSITNERLKILGKLGDYMILTSMGNETKYIIPLGGKNAFEIKTVNHAKK